MCADFKNELSALQHLAKKLGTHILCSPSKYHAKIAGKGIKYSWAITKNWFKHLALSEWRARQQFEMKVKEALSTSVLTITQARGSAKRQHSYILAYAYLHKGEEAGEGAAAAANKFADDIKKWQNYKRLTSQQLIKVQHTLQSLKWSRTTLTASAMEQKAPSSSFAACSLVGGSFVFQIFISIENFISNKCPHV
jgi:hypothetical protein